MIKPGRSPMKWLSPERSSYYCYEVQSRLWGTPFSPSLSLLRLTKRVGLSWRVVEAGKVVAEGRRSGEYLAQKRIGKLQSTTSKRTSIPWIRNHNGKDFVGTSVTFFWFYVPHAYIWIGNWILVLKETPAFVYGKSTEWRSQGDYTPLHSLCGEQQHSRTYSQ